MTTINDQVCSTDPVFGEFNATSCSYELYEECKGKTVSSRHLASDFCCMKVSVALGEQKTMNLKGASSYEVVHLGLDRAHKLCLSRWETNLKRRVLALIRGNIGLEFQCPAPKFHDQSFLLESQPRRLVGVELNPGPEDMDRRLFDIDLRRPNDNAQRWLDYIFFRTRTGVHYIPYDEIPVRCENCSLRLTLMGKFHYFTPRNGGRFRVIPRSDDHMLLACLNLFNTNQERFCFCSDIPVGFRERLRIFLLDHQEAFASRDEEYWMRIGIELNPGPRWQTIVILLSQALVFYSLFVYPFSSDSTGVEYCKAEQVVTIAQALGPIWLAGMMPRIAMAAVYHLMLPLILGRLGRFLSSVDGILSSLRVASLAVRCIMLVRIENGELVFIELAAHLLLAHLHWIEPFEACIAETFADPMFHITLMYSPQLSCLLKQSLAVWMGMYSFRGALVGIEPNPGPPKSSGKTNRRSQGGDRHRPQRRNRPPPDYVGQSQARGRAQAQGEQDAREERFRDGEAFTGRADRNQRRARYEREDEEFEERRREEIPRDDSNNFGGDEEPEGRTAPAAVPPPHPQNPQDRSGKERIEKLKDEALKFKAEQTADRMKHMYADKGLRSEGNTYEFNDEYPASAPKVGFRITWVEYALLVMLMISSVSTLSHLLGNPIYLTVVWFPLLDWVTVQYYLMTMLLTYGFFYAFMHWHGYVYMPVDRINLRYHFVLTKLEIVEEDWSDRRGVDSVQQFTDTLISSPVMRKRRWRLKRIVQTDLNSFGKQVSHWRAIEHEYKKHTPNNLFSGTELGEVAEMLLGSYSESTCLRDYEVECRVDDLMLRCCSRMDTTIEVSLEKAIEKHLAYVRRVDNTNHDNTDANLEYATSVVTAAISRYLADVVRGISSGFQLGVGRSMNSRIRRYSATYCYGYVVGDSSTPLKDLLRIGIREERTGFTRISTVKVDGQHVELGFAPVGGETFMTLRYRRNPVKAPKRLMLRRLPVYAKGVVPPIPDTSNIMNKVYGATKRIARVGAKVPMPQLTSGELREFRDFCRSFFHKHYKPLSPGADLSFETWLSQCNNYNQKRKDELIRQYNEMKLNSKADSKNRRAKFFLKTEQYPEYKYPRLINAMCDYVKIKLGPAAKAMEEIVYSNPDSIPVKFIKHVPVRERAKFIQDLFEKAGLKYQGSDYTSFECSFQANVMYSCEMQLYNHLLKYHPAVRAEFNLMCGMNSCFSKGEIFFKILARRMSGEMVTSLGNGITNMLLLMFMCMKQNCTLIGAVVEGDDGLFAIVGDFDMSKVSELGFEVKPVYGNRVGDLGFCSMYFDSSEMVQTTDILEKTARIGWTCSSSGLHAGQRIMMELLRAKASSLAYEVPGCPVLAELADYILRVTSGYASRFDEDEWWTQQVLRGVDDPNVMSSEVTDKLQNLRSEKCPSTRLLIERTQNISIDLQRRCEEYLRSKNTLGELDGPFLELFETSPVCRQWQHFHDSHVWNCAAGDGWGA